MSDEHGTLRLTVPNGQSFSFGTVTGIQESFQKSGSTTPIPSLPVDNAFTIESKTTKIISISFTRVQPIGARDSGSDSRRWSNAYWLQSIESAVGRWQCRTDGFQLTYEPASDNPYICPIDENGYVRDLSIDYTGGKPESIKGTLEFHVGTMYVKSVSPTSGVPGRAQEAFQVSLSDSKQSVRYPILYDEGGCVSSYTLCGGPETPFEYARLTIPKKKLAQTVPSLFSNGECDIKAGKNLLTINAVGTSNMTVTKVKLGSDDYTITAYCNAERVRGYVLSGGKSMKPMEWIRHILCSNQYGLNFTDASMVWQFDRAAAEKLGNISFKDGTNVWYILQICAMCVGARVFFANNMAYVIDYRSTGDALKDFGTVDLHPTNSNAMYAAATLGNTDLGDEGVDTILNTLTVNCTTNTADGKDESYQYTYRDEASVDVYTERSGGTMYLNELKQTDPGKIEDDPDEKGGEVTENGLSLNLEDVNTVFYVGDTFNHDGIRISYKEKAEGSDEEKTVQVNPGDCEFSEPDMKERGTKEVKVTYDGKSATYTIVVKMPVYNQAEKFAENYISYRREPQQSVSFTLKEMRMSGGEPTWVPYFGPVAAASEIRDEQNDVYVDNISDIDGEEMIQKLVLSSYEREYPQGRTTYTWGVMASIDLSSSTSQITTNLSNVKN